MQSTAARATGQAGPSKMRAPLALVGVPGRERPPAKQTPGPWKVTLSADFRAVAKGLSGTDLLVLLALESFARDKTFCYPSLATLADETGRHTRKIQESLVRLDEAGFIKRQHGPRKVLAGIIMLRRTDDAMPAADTPDRVTEAVASLSVRPKRRAQKTRQYARNGVLSTPETAQSSTPETAQSPTPPIADEIHALEMNEVKDRSGDDRSITEDSPEKTEDLRGRKNPGDAPAAPSREDELAGGMIDALYHDMGAKLHEEQQVRSWDFYRMVAREQLAGRLSPETVEAAIRIARRPETDKGRDKGSRGARFNRQVTKAINGQPCECVRSANGKGAARVPGSPVPAEPTPALMSDSLAAECVKGVSRPAPAPPRPGALAPGDDTRGVPMPASLVALCAKACTPPTPATPARAPVPPFKECVAALPPDDPFRKFVERKRPGAYG